MVGLAVVLQHTPLTVIVAPPSEVILPPLVAVVAVTLVIGEVVKRGIAAGSSFLQSVVRNNTRTTTITG